MTSKKRREWVRMALAALAFACLAAYALMVHSGCKGQQWALKSQAIIHAKHPELEARNCAERFPVRIDTVTRYRFIPGDTVTKHDTLVVDCDTVKGRQIVRIPYVRDRIVHDTIEKQVLVTQENTAAVKAEQMAHDKTKKESSEKSGTINTLSWGVGVAIVFIVGLCIAIGLLLKSKKL